MKMNKEKFGGFVLTPEERAEIRTEIYDLLVEYDYNPTEDAVDKIIDEWEKNKGWMVNLFKQHPNYNGKYQIAFDSDYFRATNPEEIGNFSYWMRTRSNSIKKPVKFGCFTLGEVLGYYRKLTGILNSMESVKYSAGISNIIVNGRTEKEIEAEKAKWLRKYNEYADIVRNSGGKYTVECDEVYEKEVLRLANAAYSIGRHIADNTEHLATEEFAEQINELLPEARAVSRQKVSRIINKACTIIGLHKEPDYNREFAKYSDAINPLAITRHTILSCHPIDYLTMSFGNSWSSCHTIDKNNKRGKGGDDYSGCYSSGTLSYMLDESSFVFYTVGKEYEGNQFELQDKINRNMFHIGEDKLIQGRVYPQSTDGEKGIYRQIREIVQKVIADCLDVPNMWKNVKGTSECGSVTSSYGTHYRDYTCYDDCNVSYLKDEEGNINKTRINIGHNPICPSCGDAHSWCEAVECESCYNGEQCCYNCGDCCDEDDMHLINGDWYCSECCFYCDYHERWEVGNKYDNSTYIDGYGRVCEDALYDDFYSCERCGESYHRDSDYGIVTQDGYYYCCESCAENDGYAQNADGEWVPESELEEAI